MAAAAGLVPAERQRTAAPATPNHARAMDDLRTREGQAEVGRNARDVLKPIENRSPDAAAAAAERILRRDAERTIVRRQPQPA
ncbi:MAG: hypothetical protein ACOYMK_04250 [Hyphomonadaceae bacterium]